MMYTDVFWRRVFFLTIEISVSILQQIAVGNRSVEIGDFYNVLFQKEPNR